MPIRVACCYYPWYAVKNEVFPILIQIMKRSVNKSGGSTGRLKQLPSKSELTTGMSSQQRTQINSLIRQRQPKTHSTALKDEPTSIKAKQLFAIIETFYTTLCDLPLQKLVSSAEPEVWIEEQEETLRSIEARLRKSGKEREHDYYRCRLRSIETILGNIRQNLAMLKRMRELKNYCSGTESSNYLSHRGSSFDSSKGIKLGQFASESASIKEIQEMLNYDEYPIECSQIPKSATSGCPEMMAQTVNSEVESSEEEQSMTKSEIIYKGKGKKRVPPKCGQNHNISNKIGESKYQDLKDKTLAKVQIPSKSLISINNVATENRYKGLQLSSEWTKRSQFIKDSFKLQPVPNQYLELIKELRLELLQKDKEIQKLLINQQEFDETVEIFQNRQKEKSTEILFLKENAAINDRERQKLQNQIRRLNLEAEELKETVRVERERHRKEENEKMKLEQRLQAEIEERRQLSLSMAHLEEERESSRKNQKQSKETLDVYTRKYFQLHETVDEMREQMRLLSEQLARQKERNSSLQVCESVKRIMERHRLKIFHE